MIESNEEETHSRLLRVVLMFYIPKCLLHEYLLCNNFLIDTLWSDYLAYILYVLLLTHEWNYFCFPGQQHIESLFVSFCYVTLQILFGSHAF